MGFEVLVDGWMRKQMKEGRKEHFFLIIFFNFGFFFYNLLDSDIRIGYIYQKSYYYGLLCWLAELENQDQRA